jgi:hypothetical protein
LALEGLSLLSLQLSCKVLQERLSLPRKQAPPHATKVATVRDLSAQLVPGGGGPK